MIYECDFCDSVLPAHVKSCPFCGEAFDNAVPDDAEADRLALDAPGDDPCPAALGLSSSGLASSADWAEAMTPPSSDLPSETPTDGKAWVSPYRRKAQEIMSRHLTSLRLDEESVRLLEDAEGH